MEQRGSSVLFLLNVGALCDNLDIIQVFMINWKDEYRCKRLQSRKYVLVKYEHMYYNDMYSIMESGVHIMAYDDLKPIDVICEHTADGSIIPLKLRVKDDNGEYQSYRIDSYRDLSGRGSYDTQDGIYVTNETVYFLCSISVFGRSKNVRLYYKMNEGIWRLAA